ncbi:MAG: electron transfer flavoprotein subunit alpha/FixB family protein, partial [Betaproteobacteria bacterium]|nr:electron transfer flavoprotein subunit alpha/FixB family protein [Betaproteobacteria bacterium]
MAILVIAEHDNKQLKTGVTNTIAAAAKLGSDISVLVAGSGCADAAAAAAKVAGVTKVLVADAAQYAVPLA